MTIFNINLKKYGLILIGLMFCGITAYAQPTFTKAFTPNEIAPGAVTTLTFTIDNTANGSPVGDLAFTDVFPAGMTIADPPGVVHDCGTGGSVNAPAGGNTVSFSGGQLLPGQSCTISVNVTATQTGLNTSGDLTFITPGTPGPVAGPSATLTVDNTLPKLTKAFSPTMIDVGERSTLTFTIDNTSNANQINFFGGTSFSDNLPAGMVIADPANLSFDCPGSVTAVAGSSVISYDGLGNIAGGASCTITVDVVGVSNQDTDNITSDFTFLNHFFQSKSSGKAAASLDVKQFNLHLKKEFTNDAVPAGAPVDLEFTIQNRDRDFAATNVTFSDILDANLAGLALLSAPTDPCGAGSSITGTSTITLNNGSIPAEGDCTFTITLQVPPGATAGSYQNVTSTISADVGGNPTTGNEASDLLFIEPAPVLTKTFLNNPVGPGSTTELEFTITNGSTTDEMTAISFTDEFDIIMQTASSVPAAGSCGAGSTFTFNAAANGNPAKLTVSNASLAAGGSCTFSITLDVSATAPGGIYTNTTSDITGTVNGVSYTGNPATDDLNVLSAPALTKSFNSVPAPGETVDLEFTISLDENSPTDATNISFTDDLTAMTSIPGLTVASGGTQSNICGTGSSVSVNGSNDLITFSGGTLAAGGDCTFTITLQVPANAPAGTHTNTTSGVSATVAATGVSSPAASADLLVNPITFTKSFSPSTVLPGQMTQLTFDLELDSGSPTDATGIFFSDNLSSMLSGTTATLNSNTCGGTPTILSDNFFFLVGGSLSPGTSCQIVLDVMTPANAANGTHLNTTSSLTTTIDGNPITLPAATATLTTNDEILSISKSFTDDPVAPGDDVTLEFTIVNLDATNAISNIAFSDDLNAVIPTLTATSADFNDCGGMASGFPTTNFSYSGGSLSAGGSCTIRIICNVPVAANAGTYINTTSTITGTASGIPVEGPAATDNLQIGALGFSKEFGGTVAPGCETTLSFTIENFDGVNALNDLNFTDNLENVLTGLVMVGTPPTNPCGTGSAISGSSNLSFTGGSLSPGGSCTFSVNVLVPCNASSGTYLNTTGLLREGVNPAGTGDILAQANMVVSGTNSAPNITCPNTQTIECSDSSDPAVNMSLNSATATDDCTASNMITITYNDADSQGASGCGLYQYTISRTWRAIDYCGNEATCDQTINVDDTTPPTASNPADLNAECTAPAPDPSVVTDEADNCGTPTVAHVGDVSDGNTCPETITRTYSVTDACGNSINVTQDIIIHDMTNPTASNPANLNAQCTAPAPDPSVVTDEADNCGTPTVAHVGDVSDGNSNPETITRTYSVTDGCGNSINVTQNIIINDTTNPTASNPATINAECPAPSPDPSVVTDEADNCGTPTVAFVGDVSDGNTNPETITRTYSVTDNAGNSINVEQTIILSDNTPPTASNPATITAQCTAPAPDPSVVTDEADACSTPTVAHVSDVSDGNSCPETITRTYSVTDAAGNSINVEQTIIINDNTNPTANCNNITVAIDGNGQAIYTPAQLDNSNTDNCTTNLTLSADPPSLNCSNIGNNTVTLTVEDDCGNSATCDATVTVTYSTDIFISDISLAEGSPSGTTIFLFTVTRSDNSCLATVDYSTADGTATSASGDYNSKSSTLTFPAGGGFTRTIAIQVNKDVLVEPDEIFFVNLSNPSTGANITDGQGEGTIENDDGGNLTINDVSIAEGTSVGFGTSTLTFTVTLDANVNSGFSVDYETADGTAEDENGDIDYIKTTGTLNFAGNAGETQTIDIPIWHDAKVELDENFFVNLTNLQASGLNVTILDGQGEGTIENDDSANLNIDDVSMTEGDSGNKTYTFTVSSDASVDVPFSVDYATADNTASTADADYNNANGTLNFNGINGETQTLNVQINGDCKVEADEIFWVNLSNVQASGRNVNIADGQGEGTIQNDDSLPTISNCPSNFSVNVDATCSFKLDDYTGGVSTSGGCGALVVSQAPAQNSSIGLGMNTVTLTVTDDAGNTASCDFTITATDATPPNALCQNTQVFLNPNPTATIVPAQVNGGSNDNCGTVTLVSVSPNTFDCSNIGANTVTLTVQDAAGLQATCDATVTVNGIQVVCYADTDGDSYGDSGNSQVFCFACGTGYVEDSSDCDDSNATVYPGATEICDGLDNDCDGVIDDGLDLDGDGFTPCAGDCDDNDPNNFPGNVEVCDGLDNNCDGVVDEGFDTDGDGFTTCEGDCDDTNITIFPGSPEVCDGLDNNCDGLIDEGFDLDGDGFTICNGDCDDSDPAINPGATEICDGLDNDCNGLIDDGVGGVFVGNVALLNQAQVDAFSSCIIVIVGNLVVNGNGIIDLSPLGNLTEVTQDVIVTNTSVANLIGLHSLATVGGDFNITNNGVLSELDALANLTSVGAGLNIIANNSLEDLVGLEGIADINTSVNIISNGNLISLSGLENLASVLGNLNIIFNSNLTDCCPIYDLLNGGGVAGSTLIIANNTGCDSEPVVLTTCAPALPIITNPGSNSPVVTAQESLETFQLYPNPTSDMINLPVEFLDKSEAPVEYLILSIQGKEVLKGKLSQGTYSLNVTELEDGIYFLLMQQGENNFGQRFSKVSN